MDSRLTADLERALGPEVVVRDPELVSASGTDWARQIGEPGALVRPTSADAVAALLAFANERGTPVGPRARGTNLSGGFVASPEAIVVDLSRMDRILEVDPAARRAVVEPGVLNGALQAAAAPLGLCFSPDPVSAAISSVGGNVAENAGGPACIKYGVTVHHVTALDLALPGGRTMTLSEGDPLDLLGLVIGSEGTLGIVTRIEARLRAVPPAAWTALAAFARVEDAAETVSALIAAGILPAALELCDRRQTALIEDWRPSGYPRDAGALLFAELDGEHDEVAEEAPRMERVLRGFDPHVRVARSAEERHALWAGRREAAPAIRATGKPFYVCDVTVPRHRIPDLFRRVGAVSARLGLDVATVAHAGDGNCHPVIIYEPHDADLMRAGADALTEAGLELGGTLTGEHGVGTDKVPYMRDRFGPAEIAAFRAVKRAFDPNGILNPGVLYPEVEPGDPALPQLERAIRIALAEGVAESSAEAGAPPFTPAGTAPVDPDGPTVSLDRENLVVELSAEAERSEAARALARAGFRCAALEGTGTVGAAVEREGNRSPIRPLLLFTEADLPDGPTVRFGSAAMKDVAGLDAKRLVAGGRGSFGRVRRAAFRMFPRNARPELGRR